MMIILICQREYKVIELKNIVIQKLTRIKKLFTDHQCLENVKILAQIALQGIVAHFDKKTRAILLVKFTIF